MVRRKSRVRSSQRPLVDQQRQIAPALDPLGEHGVDDRLGRRTDDQRLFQLLAASVGHHGGFGGKPLHVLRFLREEALRYEEREVRVLMPGVFEHPVQRALHLFPDGVSVGPDHHAAAHRAVVGQLGLHDELVVPGGEILGPGRQRLGVSHEPMNGER